MFPKMVSYHSLTGSFKFKAGWFSKWGFEFKKTKDPDICVRLQSQLVTNGWHTTSCDPKSSDVKKAEENGESSHKNGRMHKWDCTQKSVSALRRPVCVPVSSWRLTFETKWQFHTVESWWTLKGLDESHKSGSKSLEQKGEKVRMELLGGHGKGGTFYTTIEG